MSGLCFHLFGQFQVQFGEQIVPRIEGRKAQDFLALLLLNRNHPQPRETLAEIFWKDISSNRSKKYLRQTLWKIQSAFDLITSGTFPPLLLVDSEWVQINPETEIWIDIYEFQTTYEMVQGISGIELSSQQVDTIKSVVELYRGDLLEGCYEDWCLFERERLRYIYHALLDKLINWCQANQEYELGVGYAAKILRDDRARERTHRRLIRLYYLLGNRSAALRQYYICEEALIEELGVKPGNLTNHLFQLIQNDQGSDFFPDIPNNISALISSPTDDKEEAVHLTQLQNMLLDVCRRFQKEISRIEQLLKDES